MTVIAALELDDLVASGKATRQTNGAHGGLGTRAGHAHQRHAGHERANGFSELDLDLGGAAKAEPTLGSLYNRLANARVVVTHDHRAPGKHVINVALAVGIKEIGALGALHEPGRSTHRFEGPHGRVHATGNGVFSALEERFRSTHD